MKNISLLKRHLATAVGATALAVLLVGYVVFFQRMAPDLGVEPDGGLAASLGFEDSSVLGAQSEELVSIVIYEVKRDGQLLWASDGDDASHADLRENTLLHEELWRLFREIVPVEETGLVTVYELATDGPDGTFAQVLQSSQVIDEWILTVDPLDAYVDGEFLINEAALTFAHEFAHLLSVSDGQIIYSQEVFDTEWQDEYEEAVIRARGECPRYFLNEGCSTADSYLGLFVERFWDQDMIERSREIAAMEDLVTQEEASLAFYDEYYWDFLNDYAVTNPEEDFAESFAQFLLTDIDPGNEVYLQKIRFFEQFPELVKMQSAAFDAYVAF